jgi:hypothetical protein
MTATGDYTNQVHHMLSIRLPRFGTLCRTSVLPRHIRLS